MELTIETDPAELGFDPARLGRIDAYLRRFVDEGLIPGWQFVLSRNGSIVHAATSGLRHREESLPVQSDTLYRIYSMTKPITSVAAMMLFERGDFQLGDPVSRFLPAFEQLRVYQGGNDLNPSTVPAVEPMRMVHLLTHTSGLTYGFFRQHPVDALYRARGLDVVTEEGPDLAMFCDRLTDLPLLFQPGAEWAYSRATEVLGRVIEVISGQPLDEFFAEHILQPLGMPDTRFGGPLVDQDRLARLYRQDSSGLVPADDVGLAVDRPLFPAGGGGLISSAHDYHRFTQLLLRNGELDGHRLLGPRTVAFMTRNHLPGQADLETFGRPIDAEFPMRGVGFGLGFSVDLDPALSGRLGSAGSYGWSGAATTLFWIDPVERLTAMFFTQVFALTPLPLRETLRQLVYQALTDHPH